MARWRLESRERLPGWRMLEGRERLLGWWGLEGRGEEFSKNLPLGPPSAARFIPDHLRRKPRR